VAANNVLAYAHFIEFDSSSDLFTLFWNESNPSRRGAFISFIGRHVITRSPPEKWFSDQQDVVTNKLQKLWNWILEHCNDAKTLKEFEFWISTTVFEPVWLADHVDQTLKKGKVQIDWEIGLEDSLPEFANCAPEKTVSILRSYLIENGRGGRQLFLTSPKNLKEILTKLHANSVTKKDTYHLINDLLPLGNRRYWDLKEIISSD
jgi:hypothetical protein